jgi:hypothetical protein
VGGGEAGGGEAAGGEGGRLMTHTARRYSLMYESVTLSASCVSCRTTRVRVNGGKHTGAGRGTPMRRWQREGESLQHRCGLWKVALEDGFGRWLWKMALEDFLEDGFGRCEACSTGVGFRHGVWLCSASMTRVRATLQGHGQTGLHAQPICAVYGTAACRKRTCHVNADELVAVDTSVRLASTEKISMRGHFCGDLRTSQLYCGTRRFVRPA